MTSMRELTWRALLALMVMQPGAFVMAQDSPPPTASPQTPPPDSQKSEQPGTDSDIEPVHPTATELGAMDVCSEMSESAMTMLERVRRRLQITACASSAWLDGMFGDQLRYEDYHRTYGSVSTGALWSEYDGFDPRLRFRVRLQLPQWDERISAFAGRVGEEDYITDVEDDFDALPSRQFGGIEDESVLLGLGYANPNRTGTSRVR